MTQVSHAAAPPEMAVYVHASHVVRRTLVIGLTAFLTVVDLFVTKAVLPSLPNGYRVTAAGMSLPVNDSTHQLADDDTGDAFLSRSNDRRQGMLLRRRQLWIP